MRTLSYPEDNADIPKKLEGIIKSKSSEGYRLDKLLEIVAYQAEWIKDLEKRVKKLAKRDFE